MEEIINELFQDNNDFINPKIIEVVKGNATKLEKINQLIDESFDLYLVEMSNITKEKSGFNHCLNFMPGEGMRHGPRVKVAKSCKETNNKLKTDVIAFSSKSDAIFITNKKRAKVTASDEVIYLNFVNKNKEYLIQYWETAIDLTDEDRSDLENKIKNNF